MESLRAVLIDGVNLTDARWRWILEWSTGDPGTGEPRVDMAARHGGPGVIEPIGRAFLGASEWVFRVAVTDRTGKDLKDRGGISQRIKNQQKIMRALAPGRAVTVEWRPGGGGALFQRAVISSSIGVDEVSLGLVHLTFTVKLLEGAWRAKPTVTELSGGVVGCLAGGNAGARADWLVTGPLQKFTVTQGDSPIIEWHGSVPDSKSLVVSGLDWWLVDRVKPGRWWVSPESTGDPRALDFHDYLYPDSGGDYRVTVRVDEQPLGAGRSVIVRGGKTCL